MAHVIITSTVPASAAARTRARAAVGRCRRGAGRVPELLPLAAAIITGPWFGHQLNRARRGRPSPGNNGSDSLAAPWPAAAGD